MILDICLTITLLLLADFDSKECTYATPGELVQSNLYGCGGLESNPAYRGRYHVTSIR